MLLSEVHQDGEGQSVEDDAQDQGPTGVGDEPVRDPLGDPQHQIRHQPGREHEKHRQEESTAPGCTTDPKLSNP